MSQFYLDDLAVFKVMFTAIVTAMLGLWLLSGPASWTCRSSPSSRPTRSPQVVGGLVLGVGFVVGGYCPGTSVVSTATGRLDGLVFLLGFAAGTLGFALAFPHVQWLYTAGELGPTTLPEALGLSRLVVTLGVVLVALAGFWGASRIEAAFGQAETSRTEKCGD